MFRCLNDEIISGTVVYMTMGYHHRLDEMSRERIYMGEQRSKKISEEEALKEAEKALNALKEKEATETSSKSEKKDIKKDKAPKKVKKIKIRSKKYQEIRKLVDKNKFYEISEAIKLVKKVAKTKFNSSIEIHVRLLSEKGKPAMLRGLIQLPHSTGKKIKVGIVDEKMIEKIQKDKKVDFDILISKPEMMSKLARIARILGPQGKMPNPKSGTVSNDPEKAKKEIESGRVEYKTDSYGIIHMSIGKVNFEDKNILENYQSLLHLIPVNKLQRIHICATMSPSVRVKI